MAIVAGRKPMTAKVMSDWKEFCATLDFGPLVPEEFDRYRPVIADSLRYFLESLPPGRTIEILAEQATMPADTRIDKRLVAIARHCPALHKLGQVLARDRRLSARFRKLLQSLETMRPTQGLPAIRAALERELGPLSRLNITLDEPPLAEASVAVVVPFTWQRDPDGQLRRGVFKLLKPGIEEKLAEELAPLKRVGELLQDRCRKYGLPDMDYEGSFEEVAQLLSHETHLDEEQEHMAAARAAYQGMDSVLVPNVFPPLSTPRLTAMERIDGRKVTDVEVLPSAKRRELAVTIVEALVAHPLWSNGQATMFHADPHAGNLLVTDENRLAIVDWSLVGYLTNDDQIGLTQILLGAMALDRNQICEAIRRLARGGIDEQALGRIVDENLRHLGVGQWPDLPWLTGLLQDAITKANARFEPGLVIFRKVLESASGVVADVSEDCRMDAVLGSFFVRQFEREWGYRMIAPPFTRQFGTHLSNADLVELWISRPLTALRSFSTMSKSVWRSAAGAGLARVLSGVREHLAASVSRRSDGRSAPSSAPGCGQAACRSSAGPGRRRQRPKRRCAGGHECGHP